jgi:hypothetical protein
MSVGRLLHFISSSLGQWRTAVETLAVLVGVYFALRWLWQSLVQKYGVGSAEVVISNTMQQRRAREYPAHSAYPNGQLMRRRKEMAPLLNITRMSMSLRLRF